jgi:hypothetical protein
LWVLINSIAFLSAHPERMVLVAGALSTALAVWFTRRLYALLARESGSRWVISERWFMVVGFAAMPAFFAWGVITLMEVGLWCALFVAFAEVLAGYTVELARTGRIASGKWPRDIALLVAMSLCRPESLGIAVLALLVFVAVNAFRAPRETAIAALRRTIGHVATIAAAQGAITIFRVAYFGYPFPNTYYAKVSSNPFDNLKSGGRYLAIFLGDQYLAPLFVCGLAFALVKVVLALPEGSRRSGQDTVYVRTLALLAGITLCGIVIPILMGGDHFGSQRFFQPTFPLLAVFVALLLNEAVASSSLELGKISGWLAAAASLALVAGAAVAFFDRSKLLKEFAIATEERRVGAALTSLFPGEQKPSVGVIVAGGIHRTYQGAIYDLLALNWVEMAHATSRRRGFRNHSAFNPQVFWAHPPDIVTPIFVPDSASAATVHISLYLGSIEAEQRFRDAYRVVVWQTALGAYLTAFVSAKLAPQLSAQTATVIPWAQIVSVPPPPRD